MKRSIMLSPWLAMMMVVSGLFYATSQARAQEVPFEGVINQDDVTLRAGAGTVYYIVGQATKGSKVTVTERIADWYKISPPAGTYTYVSQGYVDVRGDGSTGTVRSRIPAYAASINGPGESYRRQLDLLAGEVVKIVGTDGSFFKIEPPQGAFVYVQTQHVTPATDVTAPAAATPAPAPAQPKAPEAQPAPTPAPAPAQPEQTPAPQQPAAQAPAPAQQTPQVPAQPEPVVQEPRAPAPQQPQVAQTPAVEPQQPAAPAVEPSTEAAPTPAPAPEQTAAVPTPAPAVETTEEPVKVQTFTVVSPNLNAVEQLFIEAQKKPIEQQPLEALRKQYEGLENDVTLTPGDHRVRIARISQIDRNIALSKAIAELRGAREQVKTSTTRLTVPPPAAQTQYDAVGMLLASSVYDGVTLPRLYRLVNAGEGRTIAYIRASDTFDAARALGNTVGIQGTTRYDTALKLRVVDVTKLDILSPGSAE